MTTVAWTDPESVFAAVAAEHDRVFWLDGGGARDWSGRFSYLGWLEPGELSLTYDAATRTVVEHDGYGGRVVGEDIFAALEQRTAAAAAAETGRTHLPAVAEGELSRSRRFGGWVGYLGYACRPDLPARLDRTAVPDAMWMQVSRYVVFDHQARTVRLHGTGPPPTVRPRRPVLSPVAPAAPSYSAYHRAFDRVQEQLRAGNSYETNLTYRVEVASEADPVSVYLRLRRLNQAPYAAYLQHAGVAVLSSSPERFATIGSDRVLETRPIKGTTPRSDDPAEDEHWRQVLGTDPKFRAENLMVVDLLRNDLSMVCEAGTVEVPELMQVESYPSVHQLVTTIRGSLRPGVSGVQAVRALFPGGSMTGAPKLRTMQIIRDVEQSARGVYSGALGWIGDDGRADLGIVIRTLVRHETSYWLGTGGGITVRSDPETEFAESQWKAERLLRALGGASAPTR